MKSRLWCLSQNISKNVRKKVWPKTTLLWDFLLLLVKSLRRSKWHDFWSHREMSLFSIYLTANYLIIVADKIVRAIWAPAQVLACWSFWHISGQVFWLISSFLNNRLFVWFWMGSLLEKALLMLGHFKAPFLDPLSFCCTLMIFVNMLLVL